MTKCSVVNRVTTPNCTPNINVSQYKNPCSYLPLDGSKQNLPKSGGRKKYFRKNKSYKSKKYKKSKQNKNLKSKTTNRRIIRKTRRSMKGGK